MDIAKLKHPVFLCTTDDVVDDGVIRLRRRTVRKTFARIEPWGSPFSRVGNFGEFGQNVNSSPSHKIIIRAQLDLEVTRFAWIYEERRISADKWYKVLDIREDADGLWWEFRTRIDTRGDDCPPEPNVDPYCGIAKGGTIG